MGRLTSFLEAGPSQPYREALAASERADRDRERVNRELLEQAVEGDLATPAAMLQSGTVPSRVERLPEHLRDRGRALVAERRGSSARAGVVT